MVTAGVYMVAAPERSVPARQRDLGAGRHHRLPDRGAGGDHRDRADRHQEGATTPPCRSPATCSGLRRRLQRRHLPRVHPRLLQGASSWPGPGHPRHGRRAGHAAHGRAQEVPAGDLSHLPGGHHRDRRHSRSRGSSPRTRSWPRPSAPAAPTGCCGWSVCSPPGSPPATCSAPCS